MKNTATGIGLAVLGLGIAISGLDLDGNRADATPATFAPAGDPAQPTIVWYGTSDLNVSNASGGSHYSPYTRLFRAWSDGTVEMKQIYNAHGSCHAGGGCEWTVVSTPNEGLNAQADINFDARVDAADLGMVLAAWGDAPRNDLPPSDCPLGLIP